jgi:hypothetical protein
MNSRAKGQSSARGSNRRGPFTQGDLDGLCGVYAVVNALRFLCREMDHDTCRHLFRALVQSLEDEARAPFSMVSNGLHTRTLRALVRRAIAYARSHLRIFLIMRRLPKQARGPRFDDLWATLADALDGQQVAILGLGGTHSHWTVAIRVTSRTIRLFDSDRMVLLHRARCTTGRDASKVQLRSVVLIGRRDA